MKPKVPEVSSPGLANPRDAQPGRGSYSTARPPPYWWASGQAQPIRQSTNGFAVASLVLSILWVLGLGSLLAVIFGATARRQIRDSGGTQSGDGLALAGFILGIVGVLGAVLFWAAVVAIGAGVRSDLTPHTTSLRYGQPAVFPTNSFAFGQGVAQVTVESLSYPANSTDPSVQPLPGQEFAVASVQVCAGPNGSTTGLSPFEFLLLLPAGQTARPSIENARSPSVNSLNALGPRQCATGYVTFQITQGQVPTGVQYGLIFPSRIYLWH